MMVNIKDTTSGQDRTGLMMVNIKDITSGKE